MPRNDHAAHARDPEPVVPAEEHTHEEEVAQNPLMVVHRLLKGRYHWAITLGLIGLILGGLAGFFVTEPLYNSYAQVRVRPVLPRVMYPTDQNSMMPMFESFVRSQVALIGSRRVIDHAIEHEDWQPYAEGSVDDQVAEFSETLIVDHPRHTELINITFPNPDPRKSQAAVSAIVHAYKDLYGEVNEESSGLRQQTLQQRRLSLENQLDSLEDQIAAVAGQFGPEGLTQMHQLKVQELGKLEQKLNSLEIARAVAEGRENKVDASTRQKMSSEDLSAEQIGVVDNAMSRLLQEKRKQEAVMEELAQTLGSSHRRMVKARSQLDSIDKAITERAQVFRTMRGTVTPGEVSDDAVGLTLEQIRDQERRVRQLYEGLEAETLNLAQKQRTINGLRDDMTLVQGRLTATKNRLDALDIESTIGGRIDIVSYGDVPVLPAKDRRAPLAVAGAGAGALGGIGIMLLLGLLDRRLHHVDDACRSTGQPPLLGVVPQLPEPSDPESLLLTGQSVHHIRTQLQIGAKSSGAQVFTVAGSSPGTGKTSLTLAMGLSYAASNHRVLLIDADLTGAALTQRATSITRHLLRGALTNDGRLEGEDFAANASFQDIVDSGALTKQEVQDIHDLRSRIERGLPAALDGAPLKECVAEVGPPGLAVLTSGVGEDDGRAPNVSPARFRRILDEARQDYEAVLIDTGPIPGPIESSVAASEADGVVLLLARGDDRARTEYTVDFLHSIGAHLLGMVFNRAGEDDVSVFGYSSSASTSRPTASRTAALTRLRDDAGSCTPAGVGPMVQAVLCTSRSMDLRNTSA